MTDQTPRTEAGRLLLAVFENGDTYRDFILAIEAETRAEAWNEGNGLGFREGHRKGRADALREARDAAYINKPEGYREGWAAAMALVREHEAQARTEALDALDWELIVSLVVSAVTDDESGMETLDSDDIAAEYRRAILAGEME